MEGLRLLDDLLVVEVVLRDLVVRGLVVHDERDEDRLAVLFRRLEGRRRSPAPRRSGDRAQARARRPGPATGRNQGSGSCSSSPHAVRRGLHRVRRETDARLRPAFPELAYGSEDARLRSIVPSRSPIFSIESGALEEFLEASWPRPSAFPLLWLGLLRRRARRPDPRRHLPDHGRRPRPSRTRPRLSSRSPSSIRASWSETRSFTTWAPATGKRCCAGSS